MRSVLAAGLILGGATLVQANDPLRPAEMPSSDYAGLQYVDSKGCAFVRAGVGSEVLWVPRVSRIGKPDCDNPPSGRRVPVAEEIGAAPFEPGVEPSAQTVAPQNEGLPSVTAPGGYFVAVGSFGVADNADRAAAKLGTLGYGVVRGRVEGGSQTLITVFAGPFADAAAAGDARRILRGNGFPDAVVMGQ
jgi:cell division septation protein DedD